MQKILSKYAVAAHLALLSVSPLFLFPYCGPSAVATVLLWLSLVAALWVVLEPSRHKDEQLHDARRRVASAIVHDPLFWVFLLLTAIGLVRWLNDGIMMAYDAENEFWYLRKPALPYFPGSVAGCGRLEFATLVATCVVVTGIRHALGRAARLSFLFVSSLLAAIAATEVAFAAYFGNAGARAATEAALDSPSFAGAVFGFYALGGVAALAGALESRWRKVSVFFTLAIGGSAAGVFLFAPPAVVLLFAAALLLMLLFVFVWVGAVTRGATVLKCFAALFVAATLATLLVISAAPDGLSAARTAPLFDLSVFPADFAEMRRALSAIAAKVWGTNPWLGSGLGSFPYDIRFNATEADWAILPVSQKAALSGWWTFIAERGIVGALMFAVPVGFLAFTFFRRIPGAIGRRVFLPACGLGFLSVAAAVAESFIDVSFLRPEAILALAAFLALTAGALPPVKRKTAEDND